MKNLSYIIFFINCFFLKSLNIRKNHKEDTYELIPDEISFDKPLPPPPSPYVYNLNKYHMDLQRERIDPFEEAQSYNGKVYYKNPFPYYGPKTTYRKIPEVKDVKFNTPVVVGELDNINDKASIIKELEETERELAHHLLFIDLPKNIKKVKQNDFLPYYDPSYADRLIKIERMKNRILQLRNYLNINDEDVNFYVEVRNSTFPQGPMDIVNHLNNSYYYADVFDGKASNITNGKYKKVGDIYKERHNHLQKNFDALDVRNMMKSLRDLFANEDGDDNNEKSQIRKPEKKSKKHTEKFEELSIKNNENTLSKKSYFKHKRKDESSNSNLENDQEYLTETKQQDDVLDGFPQTQQENESLNKEDNTLNSIPDTSSQDHQYDQNPSATENTSSPSSSKGINDDDINNML